jgi:hypothetical protein
MQKTSCDGERLRGRLEANAHLMRNLASCARAVRGCHALSAAFTECEMQGETNKNTQHNNKPQAAL